MKRFYFGLHYQFHLYIQELVMKDHKLRLIAFYLVLSFAPKRALPQTFWQPPVAGCAALPVLRHFLLFHRFLLWASILYKSGNHQNLPHFSINLLSVAAANWNHSTCYNHPNFSLPTLTAPTSHNSNNDNRYVDPAHSTSDTPERVLLRTPLRHFLRPSRLSLPPNAN